MAWTAEITGTSWQSGILYVNFRYTDGARVLTETHKVGGTVPEEWAQKTADARVKALEAVDALTISTGAVPAPTPEDAGLIAFRQKLRKLDVIYKLVQMGAVAQNDSRVTSFANNLKTDLGTYWNSI